MRAPVIAVAFAVGLGAGPSAHGPVAGDTVPASESVLPGSDGDPTPAGGVSAIVDSYLRFHADVRAEATMVGFPGRELTGGAAMEPASDRAGGETPRAVGQPRLTRALR